MPNYIMDAIRGYKAVDDIYRQDRMEKQQNQDRSLALEDRKNNIARQIKQDQRADQQYADIQSLRDIAVKETEMIFGQDAARNPEVVQKIGGIIANPEQTGKALALHDEIGSFLSSGKTPPMDILTKYLNIAGAGELSMRSEKDGFQRKVESIVPSPKKGEVMIGFSVVGKDGKVYNAPMTTGGSANPDDNVVQSIPISKLMEWGNGYASAAKALAMARAKAGDMSFLNSYKAAQLEQAKRATDLQEYEKKKMIDQKYKDPVAAGRWGVYDNGKFIPNPSGGAETHAPSALLKMINERQSYLDQGLSEEDPIIKAYDAKISGTDVAVEDMTQEEIDTFGQLFNLTGKMPSLGRGKQSTKVRMQIARSAAHQALDSAQLIPGADPNKRPSTAALEIIGGQADKKAIGGAITLLQKQSSSMGSFVNNIEQQVDKVQALSKDLSTFDTRLLNIPLRAIRGKLAGNPLQAKYDMYLAEIESEIGKLATGSTASIAELSATAQERWAKIHDKNLNIKDMMSLLQETKAAARMRMKSVEDELEKARAKMRSRGIVPEVIKEEKPTKPTTEVNVPPTNEKGWSLKKDTDGNMAYVSPDGSQFEEVK